MQPIILDILVVVIVLVAVVVVVVVVVLIHWLQRLYCFWNELPVATRILALTV